jgi:hypothetical protein
MAESLYKPVPDVSGVEIANVYPLGGDGPFFADLVKLAGGASTAMHRQAGGYCYRLTAVTTVSGLSLMQNETGRYDVNEHVYLRPGEYLTRPRDFTHVFVNSLPEDIVMLKTFVPIDDCPLRKAGSDTCVCREKG